MLLARYTMKLSGSAGCLKFFARCRPNPGTSAGRGIQAVWLALKLSRDLGMCCRSASLSSRSLAWCPSHRPIKWQLEPSILLKVASNNF
jgi:hypothetical protein